MTHEQTEREIRANKPFELFSVEQENGKAKSYKVQCLPINRADDWLELALEVDDAHTAAQGAAGKPAKEQAAVRKKFNDAIYGCVFAYDPVNLPEDELRDVVTPAAMLMAFYKLRDLTDPFERAQQVMMDRMRDQMEAIPEALRATAMEAGMRRLRNPTD